MGLTPAFSTPAIMPVPHRRIFHSRIFSRPRTATDGHVFGARNIELGRRRQA